jgi:eukaryotic-like serine/threonine-protein kinase
MTEEQWGSVENYFDRLREVPARERPAQLCAIADEEVRREVESLLEHATGTTHVKTMIGAMAARAGEMHSGGADVSTGRHIGPYRVIRRLGQGGQGTVFEAMRDDGTFRQRVALKIVKRDMDTLDARRRFRQERQILARLEHPLIGRLLDGGETEDGAPYLVMEFIEGESLIVGTEGWPLRRKLELFRKILAAVAFAHRNLIVHRDLKPSNIFVSRDGDPKLLDFGIAKLMQGEVQDDAGQMTKTMTMTSAGIMTPDYASPEQVRSEPPSVATDIYSLGAILYELLSGARPHRLATYATAEIYRAICEETPLAPSAAAKDPQLRRQLCGDLDTLVLHALNRDAAARYPSADAFREEIERYLEGRSLRVRPASPLDRAWRFTKRNRLAVGAGVALAASLIGGITVSAIEARRAQRRFAQVRELATTFLFQFYDQVTPLAGSTAVRASIVETARKYLDGLAREAGNDKDLVFELAQAYARLGTVQGAQGRANLGQMEEARRSFDRSVELYARLPVNRDAPAEWRRKAAEALIARAGIEYVADRGDAAEPIARRALALVDHPDPGDGATRLIYGFALEHLGEIRQLQGQSQEALMLGEAARKTFLDLISAGGAEQGKARDELIPTEERVARTKVRLGDLDGALAGFQEMTLSGDACDESAPVRKPCRVWANHISWTADVYAATDRPNLHQPDKAAPLYRRSVHILEILAAEDPQDRQMRFDLASRYGKLGDALWQADPKGAIELYDRALATAQALVSKEQVGQLRAAYLNAIGRPLILLGRNAEARRALNEWMQVNSKNPSPEYSDKIGMLEIRMLIARNTAAEGRPDESMRLLDEATADGETLRAGHPNDLTAIYMLSNCYRELASIAKGERRRQALLRSAAAWHSWPATSYTIREEQHDLTAAGSQ